LGIDVGTGVILEYGVRPVTSTRRCAWRAGKEPKPQPNFEPKDGVAERQPGNAQLRCSFRETALSPYGQEGQEVIQISALHLWLLLKVHANYGPGRRGGAL
jgi:hypothetical protein